MSLHTRVVLRMTLTVGLIGTVLLLVIGLRGNGPMDPFDAVFHAFASRTTGLNVRPMAGFGVAGLTLMGLLMFIGGSPGSCAGGIKTTTLAIWLRALIGGLRGRQDVTLFGRVILPELVTKARLLVGLSCLFNILGVMLLCLTEASAPAGTMAPPAINAQAEVEVEAEAEVDAARVPPPSGGEGHPARRGWNLIDLMFEQISAFATVGLSTGVTPTLSAAGRLWVIFAMFIGRLGPLGIALWIMPTPKARVRGAHGRIMIG